MDQMKGKCKCGHVLHTLVLKGFDFFIVGLIIGALMFFPLGCTYGKGKQKVIQIESWERWEQ